MWEKDKFQYPFVFVKVTVSGDILKLNIYLEAWSTVEMIIITMFHSLTYFV